MKKGQKALGERVRSVIILFLCVCLFAFSMLFMLLKLTGDTSVLPELTSAHLLQLSSSDSSQKGASSYLVPTFCAVIIDNEGYALPYDSEARRDFSERVNPYLSRAFSGSCTVTERNSRQWEEAYKRIYSFENAYFMQFEKEIPSFCVNTLLGNVTTPDSTAQPFLFDSLFVGYDTNLSVTVYAVNKGGDIALFIPEEQTLFNKDDFSAYNNIGSLYSFDFYNADAILKIPAFSESVPVKDAILWDFASRFELSEQSESVKNILESFAFNPNNTNRYFLPDESVGFVEASGELVVNDDGHVSYIGTGEGIPLYTFRKEGGASVIEDCVSVACHILSSLDKNYFGKDAKIGILDVYMKDALLYVDFGYYLDGVAVEDKSISFAFSENALVGAELDALICSASAEHSFDIPQNLALSLAKAQGTKVLGAKAQYCEYSPLEDRAYDKDSFQNDMIASAKWVFVVYPEVSE